MSLGYGDQVLAANAPLYGLSYGPRSEMFEVEMEGIGHRVTRPRNVFVEWQAGGSSASRSSATMTCSRSSGSASR